MAAPVPDGRLMCLVRPFWILSEASARDAFGLLSPPAAKQRLAVSAPPERRPLIWRKVVGLGSGLFVLSRSLRCGCVLRFLCQASSKWPSPQRPASASALAFSHARTGGLDPGEVRHHPVPCQRNDCQEATNSIRGFAGGRRRHPACRWRESLPQVISPTDRPLAGAHQLRLTVTSCRT